MIKVRNFLVYSFPILLCLVIVALYNFWDNKHIKEIEYSLIKKNNSDSTYLMARSHKGVLVKTHEYHYFTDYVIIGNIKNVAKIISKNGAFDINEAKVNAISESNLINVADSFKGKPMYSINAFFPHSTSKLPYVKHLINWNGDANYFFKTFTHPLVLLISILIGLYLVFKRNIKNITLAPLTTNFRFNYTFLITALLISIGFAIKILQDNYFFLQDDNYAQFTPVLIQGLNDWYANGTIPTYNPFQFAGVPTAEFSTYAFFYPITHLSYLIAKFGLENQLQFNNVFAILHFIGGSYFVLKIFNHYRCNQFFAVIGTVAFILCGFSLEVTRSWYYTTPAVLFLPLLFWLLIKYDGKSISLKKQILLGLLLASFAYSGNFQFFTYTILFALVFYFVNSSLSFFVNIKKLIVPILIAAILFAPQFITTLIATIDNDRNGAGGESTLMGVTSFFLPYVFGETKSYYWGQLELRAYAHYLYHGPFFFLLSALVFSLYNGLKKYTKQTTVATPKYLKILLWFFFIALGLSFGRNFIFWIIHSKLPLLSRFTIPFKFILFLQFFGTVSGVIICSQLLKSKIQTISITLISFVVAFVSIYNTQDALSIYPRFHNNYPSASFFETIKKDSLYRTINFTIMRSMDPEYNKTLDNNLATMQQIQHINGYEPLFNNELNYEKYYNELGVKYFIVSHLKPSRLMWAGNTRLAPKFVSQPNVVEIYKDASVTVYRNDKALPIVQIFDKNDSLIQTTPSIINRNNGVTINFKQPTAANRIILAYNYLKGLRVKANGQAVKTSKDSINRIILYPTEAIHSITTTYIPRPF